MTTTLSLIQTFVPLLLYPSFEYRKRLEECVFFLEEENNIALEIFQKFIEETKTFSTEDFEELYTRTFDINPVASLEIGWHLYGEQYERGAFLVTMRELLRENAIPESTELPDHFSYILLLIERMEHDEATEFVNQYVFPFLEKIRVGFSEEQNPYTYLFNAIEIVLKQTFNQINKEPIYGES
jgi:nitrate reductase molybdenum cofactor assembly chaperone